jgi:hypothetical protein
MSDVRTTSEAPGIEPREHTTPPVRAEAGARHARDGLSFRRLAWVAPLTVVAALAVNLGIRALVQTDPSLGRMPQLGPPLITLTLVGAVVGVLAFVLFALLVSRPIFWYRAVVVAALLVSWIPDVMLLMGGQAAGTAMRVVGPIATLGSPAPGGPRPGGGGPPPGGPVGGFPGAALEQVLVLMLLHAATAVVCLVMLTTLSRGRRQARALPTRVGG